MDLINVIELSVILFKTLLFLGMVTAEMFQSLYKKDVMQKMTETFDKVGATLILQVFFI